jgi:deoxyribose-phosphate aldolase
MTGQKPSEEQVNRIARAIEYTDLRKTICIRDVETMCAEAVLCGLGGVVVPSALVREAARCLGRGGLFVGTVISYPFGTQSSVVKAREAAVAVDHGANELDVVAHFGAIFAERWNSVREELAEIRRAAEEVSLKLVLEAERLSMSQMREACAIAADEGFEYVVNTVGFRIVSTDPEAEGTASIEGVRSLRELAGDSLRLKAAGGITTLEQANDLLGAGADRVAIPALPGLLRAMGWMAGSEEGES